MLRATYRMRPDGVYEIVRPWLPLRRLEMLLAMANTAVGIGSALGAVVVRF
jgi:hypothetical protein